MAVKPVFVHLHNPQRPRRTLSNLSDQLGRPVKLAIMFSLSIDSSSKLRVKASSRSSIVIAIFLASLPS
jgi:hypothetical protein